MSTATARDARPPALLLLGPTGSGKTPLGEALEREGLAGAPCRHFDFGAELRAVAADGAARGFGPDDVAFVRAVLAGGRLLEDRDFPLAERILRAFLARTPPAARVVLNGLPRHAGQARDVARILRVEAVVCLDCPPEVVRARIASDAGGDRAGRADDSPAEVARKLALYRARTAPLLDHYRSAGVHICALDVGPHTLPGDARARLEAQWPRGGPASAEAECP